MKDQVTPPGRVFDQHSLIVSELLEHTAEDGIPSRRAQAMEAGRPLLAAAQQAAEIRGDVTLGHIFDVIVAIAKIPGSPEFLEPIIRTMLNGLQCRTQTAPTGRTDPPANGIKR